MGLASDGTFSAEEPHAIYNPDADEYLVIWYGDDNTTTVDNELEIFGQRLTATGLEVGDNDFSHL